ncbi:DMT family transporter [Pseudogracilibacillus sp. SO30301A]|uniref:DMT family transporter n=1 Tax=Pseudogracilibacillus sp. SO30301A TaxID=3098291 RepID=UPI00300E024C
MAWLTLVLAGLFETFAVAMINQLSVKRNWQTVFLIIFGLGSALGLLSYSLQTIPMATGYAIWTGISVVGSSLIGMIYFGESKDWKRMLFITLILGSAIGLKLIT